MAEHKLFIAKPRLTKNVRVHIPDEWGGGVECTACTQALQVTDLRAKTVAAVNDRKRKSSAPRPPPAEQLLLVRMFEGERPDGRKCCVLHDGQLLFDESSADDFLELHLVDPSLPNATRFAIEVRGGRCFKNVCVC
jgi:hypothetical protein